MPATGKPGSRPSTAIRDLGAVGLVPDGCDGAWNARECGPARRLWPRRQNLVDPDRRTGRQADLSRGLACPEQRAREHERRRLGPFGERNAEGASLFEAARGELTVLVGIAGKSLGVAAEIDAHRGQDRRKRMHPSP